MLIQLLIADYRGLDPIPCLLPALGRHPPAPGAKATSKV
jgi:hypothetical protein